MIHIIGGGLQGCFFAIALMEQLSVPRDRIRIYDPHDKLLANWRFQTSACGMTHLRSSSSHSIHPDFNHLRGYARDRGIPLWDSPEFARPYHRPSIELFNSHARSCIERYGLESIHRRHKAVHIDPEGGLVLDDGSNLSGTVIYAGGFQHGGLKYPPWVGRLRSAGKYVRHVFEKEGAGSAPFESSPLIIGGGISALQYALKAAGEGKKPVLATRRPLEVYRFDFDPCFVGPKCRPLLKTAESTEGVASRMKIILEHRYSGTVPSEIARQFLDLCSRGAASHRVIEADVHLAEFALTHEGPVIFCTGFEKPDSGSWGIGGLAGAENDPSDFVRGYPIPGADMRIGQAAFLSGGAAMYRLGPAAPNIIGAHLAWRIIRRQLARDW